MGEILKYDLFVFNFILELPLEFLLRKFYVSYGDHNSFTNKLEEMIKDIELGSENYDLIKEEMKKNGYKFEVGMVVIRATSWPSVPIIKCKRIPNDILVIPRLADLFLPKIKSSILNIAFHPNEPLASILDSKGCVHIVSVNEKNNKVQYSLPFEKQLPRYCLCYTASGERIIVGPSRKFPFNKLSDT